jgi:hypothetical protein
VQPAGGAGQLERVLEALARVSFSPDAARLEPPVHPAECVLVTPHRGADPSWGDVFAGEGP